MPNHKRSIKSKLTRVVLLTSLSGLGLACTCLLAYEIHSYRKATAHTLVTIAEIVAENSSAVLIFDDRDLAATILAGLRAEPEIMAAALFDRKGELSATYSARGTGPDRKPPGVDGVELHFLDITVTEPVMQAGSRVGTLVFEGDLRGTYYRASIYGLLLLTVGAVSGLVALIQSNYLQRQLSQPLLDLAETTRAISARKDYFMRAHKSSDDEIGDLTDAFNGMLDEIQRSNLAMRESEERFRTLADHMAQLAWIADEAGQMTWYNRRWYDYTGAPATAESLSEGNQYVHPEHRERVLLRFQECLQQGSTWEDTFPIRSRDGSHRWFLSHALPIRDDSAVVTRWFGTHTDVTELRETQRELKQARDEALAASRAKDEFLATLSHELRTPLNPVLLVTSDRENSPDLPADVRHDFEMIRKNVELEARLIDDMLDLTAVSRGKLSLNLRPIRANRVLQDALVTVRAEIVAKQIGLNLMLDADEAEVRADQGRLQQVFWNVLKNAVKFSPLGGAVTVVSKTDRERGTWTIEISDNGIGMTAEETERIFNAFAQGDHATGGASHRFGGLGLGLVISRKLVELHRGQIRASSAGRGRGARFLVELPLHASPPAPLPATMDARLASPPAVPRPVVRTFRVLLVEDHPSSRVALERLLQARGHAVTATGTVAEALESAQNQSFDLLISDIGLPDGTGNEVMLELGKRYQIPGIALTGYGMEQDVATAKTAGFLIHLTKPVTLIALEEALKAAMSAREAAGSV